MTYMYFFCYIMKLIKLKMHIALSDTNSLETFTAALPSQTQVFHWLVQCIQQGDEFNFINTIH